MRPLASKLDISLVGILSTVEGGRVKMIGHRKMHDPAMDRRMIGAIAAFGHHFLQVAQARPSVRYQRNAHNAHRRLAMPTFEHCQSLQITGGKRHTDPDECVCNRTIPICRTFRSSGEWNAPERMAPNVFGVPYGEAGHLHIRRPIFSNSKDCCRGRRCALRRPEAMSLSISVLLVIVASTLVSQVG